MLFIGTQFSNLYTAWIRQPDREVSPLSWWGYSRPNLIRSYAQRLPGRRPSSAVHHFGYHTLRREIRGFITQLRKFHCATCAVSKRTRRYRRSKRVKVAAVKRATQARTVRTRKPSADVVLNDSKNAEHAGEQEEQEQGSGTTIKQLTCHGRQRIFGNAQGLGSHLKESNRMLDY